MTGSRKPVLSQVLDGEAVIRIQDMLRRVPVGVKSDDVIGMLLKASKPREELVV